MVGKRKAFALILSLVVTFSFLILPLAKPVNAQITSHYGAKVGDSGAKLVGFVLTVYSPDNQTVFNTTLPLVFKIGWIYGLIFEPNAIMYPNYTYCIDNNQPVNIPSNQTSESYLDFKANQSFSITVDISNLTNGKHQLVIGAGLEYCFVNSAPDLIFNQTTTPITFTVDNQTPTLVPTPTVPELSWLVIVPLLLSLFSVAVIFRHRKTQPSQETLTQLSQEAFTNTLLSALHAY